MGHMWHIVWIQNVQKIALFFWRILAKSAQNLGNKHFFLKFGSKNGTYTRDVTQIGVHKNCTFFRICYKYTVKGPFYGTYTDLIWKWNVQKIELFFNITIHFQLKTREIWDIYGRSDVHKNCNFFELFFRKSENFLGNKHFLGKNMADNGTYAPWVHVSSSSVEIRMCKKLQFFSKNWHFFEKKALFPRKWAFFGQIMAHYWHICRLCEVHKNCNFFQFFQQLQ